jgi:hypothetical protein
MEERERRSLCSPVLSAGSGPPASGSGAYLYSEVLVLGHNDLRVRFASISHVRKAEWPYFNVSFDNLDRAR